MNQEDAIQFKKTQLKLFDAVYKICSEHGLRHWINFGTLLEVVHHKGFIPWDNDVDVSMPIEEFPSGG